MLSSLAVLALAGSSMAQLTFSEPTITLGSGPSPPPFTGAVATGTWTPTGSVTVTATTSGISTGVFPPPAITGIGKQAQIVDATNFCVYLPPDPTTQNLVEAEANAVAICFNPYNNTRPMPDGFITTAHFRRTPDYIQVSGSYSWPFYSLNPYDCGGEYDNHGAQGLGNPVGAFIDGGDNWFQFLGGCDTPGERQFVIRNCFGPNSYPYCRNTFDLMGALWVAPGDYLEPGFTNCLADSDLPVGVYNSSYTFAQGMTPTPPPVTAPASSQCTTLSSPTASGVTYSFAQLAYATGISSASSSASGSSRSSAATGTSKPASSTGTAPASGASALNVGAAVGAGIVGLGMLVGGVLVW